MKIKNNIEPININYNPTKIVGNITKIVNTSSKLISSSNINTAEVETVDIEEISNERVSLPENGGPYDPRNDKYGLFGGNQGSLQYNLEYYIDNEKVRQIISKYYPDFDSEDIELLFSRMNSVGCGYIASINTIFQQYLFNNEIDFYNRFGFPPYNLVKDQTTGKVYKDFNYEFLFLDFFLYCAKEIEDYETIEEVYGNQADIISGDLAISSDETSIEGMNGILSPYNILTTLKRYLADKGVDTTVTSWVDTWVRLKVKYGITEDVSRLDKVVLVIKESLKEGKQVMVVDENFNLYYPEDIDGNGLFDDIAYSDVGAHALSVVDITDSNQLIVSSWGKEYIIDISDIVQASVTTIEYNDFSSDYESFVK